MIRGQRFYLPGFPLYNCTVILVVALLSVGLQSPFAGSGLPEKTLAELRLLPTHVVAPTWVPKGYRFQGMSLVVTDFGKADFVSLRYKRGAGSSFGIRMQPQGFADFYDFMAIWHRNPGPDQVTVTVDCSRLAKRLAHTTLQLARTAEKSQVVSTWMDVSDQSNLRFVCFYGFDMEIKDAARVMKSLRWVPHGSESRENAANRASGLRE